MVKKDLLKMFSSIDNFIIKKNYCKTFIAKIIIIGHLKALETQFCKYFISNIDFKKLSWIQKPFLIGLSEIDYLPYKAQEQGRSQKKIERGPNFATFNVMSFT